MYPWAEAAASGRQSPGAGLGPDQAPNISSVLSLLDVLPPELLPANPNDFVVLEAAKGAMRGALANWAGGPSPGLAAQLAPSALFGGHSPIVAVLRVLQRCADEGISEDTSTLLFISDETYRESLRIDISTAFRTFGNGEYKAATVLAGAVLEAVLLNVILGAPEAELRKSVATLPPKLQKRLQSQPEHWLLADYITVACHMSLIDNATVRAAELCREFRNFIHPGVEVRTRMSCTQATALLALGAMTRVIEVTETRARAVASGVPRCPVGER
jgi:hypothetical protein